MTELTTTRAFLPGRATSLFPRSNGVSDSDALREQLVPGKRLVIVGGGYIGLEVVASATKKALMSRYWKRPSVLCSV